MSDQTFLFIADYGASTWCDTISQKDIDTVELGLLSIYDISNPTQPKELSYINIDGEFIWEDIIKYYND